MGVEGKKHHDIIFFFFQAKQLIHRHRGGSDGKLKYAYLEIYFYNKNVFATGRWGRIAVVGFP